MFVECDRMNVTYNCPRMCRAKKSFIKHFHDKQSSTQWLTETSDALWTMFDVDIIGSYYNRVHHTFINRKNINNKYVDLQNTVELVHFPSLYL